MTPFTSIEEMIQFRKSYNGSYPLPVFESDFDSRLTLTEETMMLVPKDKSIFDDMVKYLTDNQKPLTIEQREALAKFHKEFFEDDGCSCIKFEPKE